MEQHDTLQQIITKGCSHKIVILHKECLMLGVQQIIKRNFLQIILNVLNLRTVHMLKYSPQNDDYHIL
jgi:hypothetical protein